MCWRSSIRLMPVTPRARQFEAALPTTQKDRAKGGLPLALKFFRSPQAVHEAVHGGRVDVAADDAVAVDEQLREHRVRCSGIVCHAIGVDAARLAGIDGQVEALLLLQGVVIAEHAVKCAREHDLLRSFGRGISLPAERAQICDAPIGRGDIVVRREYAVVAAPDNQKRQHHRQRDERIHGRSSCPMKGFELHNHTPEQTYSNLPPDMLYYFCLTIEEGSDMIRLDKYLADTGAASRREAKMYIRRGEVTVDGVPAAAPEQKIAETAVVCLRGQPLHYQTYHYYMLHKPSGVLTATSDRSQPTVLDLFPPELQRFGLVPAGRLEQILPLYFSLINYHSLFSLFQKNNRLQKLNFHLFLYHYPSMLVYSLLVFVVHHLKLKAQLYSLSSYALILSNVLSPNMHLANGQH